MNKKLIGVKAIIEKLSPCNPEPPKYLTVDEWCLLASTIQSILSANEDVSVDTLAILILQSIRGCSGKTAKEIWTGKHYKLDHKEIANRVSQSISNYIQPIMRKLGREKDELLNRIAELNKINKENAASAVDYENQWNVERKEREDLQALIDNAEPPAKAEFNTTGVEGDYGVDGISINTEEAEKFHNCLKLLKKYKVLQASIDNAELPEKQQGASIEDMFCAQHSEWKGYRTGYNKALDEVKLYIAKKDKQLLELKQSKLTKEEFHCITCDMYSEEMDELETEIKELKHQLFMNDIEKKQVKALGNEEVKRLQDEIAKLKKEANLG